jgi:hypothetical protein
MTICDDDGGKCKLLVAVHSNVLVDPKKVTCSIYLILDQIYFSIVIAKPYALFQDPGSFADPEEQT